MRRQADPATVIDAVASASGLGRERATALVSVFRDCVDEVLADDGTIVARQLAVGYPADPVAARFAGLFHELGDEFWAALEVGDHEVMAEQLDLDLALVDRHPLVGEVTLMVKVLDRLHIDERKSPAQAAAIGDGLRTWLESFVDERKYRLSDLGPERLAEDWLVDHLDQLGAHGYPVDLKSRQSVFSDRRRPDLVCRFYEAAGPAAAGDWLVMELKRYGATTEAVEQLTGYVEHIRDRYVQGDERVFGLLIADGYSPKVRDHLIAAGMDSLSWTRLGYRADVAGAVGFARGFVLGHGTTYELLLRADSLVGPVFAVHPMTKQSLTLAMTAKEVGIDGGSVLDVLDRLHQRWWDLASGTRPLEPGLDRAIGGATVPNAPQAAHTPPERLYTVALDGEPILVLETPGLDQPLTRAWDIHPRGEWAEHVADLTAAARPAASCVTVLSKIAANYAKLEWRAGDPLTGVSEFDTDAGGHGTAGPGVP